MRGLCGSMTPPEQSNQSRNDAGHEAEDPRPRLFSRLWASDVVLVAAASLVGYSLVFCYEAGFCTYFGIPYDLIKLNMTTGFAVAGVLFISLYSLIFYSPAANIFAIRSDSEMRVWADELTWAALSALLFLRLGVNSVAIACWLILLAILTWLVRRYRGFKPYAATHTSLVWPVKLLIAKLSVRAHFVLALLSLVFLIVFAVGRGEAAYEPKYILGTSTGNYLVLRFYGDYVITAPITVSHQETVVEPGLRILKLGDGTMASGLTTRQWPIKSSVFATKHTFWGWLFSYNDAYQ